MNKKTLAQLASTAALLTVLTAVTVSPALAHRQEDKSQANVPNLTCENADIRDTLRSIFRQEGVSYEIDPAVQGSVTLSLKNVTFETALQNILRQVDATYRVEAGVYQVVPRHPSESPATSFPAAPSASGQTAIAVDGKYVFVVRGSTLYEIEKSNLHIVAKCKL